MSQRLVAIRYAKALLQIGEQQGRLQALQKELNAVDALVRSSSDLERLCQFPLIAPARRANAFDAVLERVGASELLRRFFRVVAESARLDHLHALTTAFNDLVDQRMGIVEARVSSAQPLTDGQTETLRHSLAARTGRTVRVAWRHEPRLLGGLKVQVGSTVYDATLLGQLQQLKGRLLSGGSGCA